MIISDLISEFMSTIVSEGIDCAKDAIKEALKQKAKGHNTLHIQMYNVIVETMKDMAAPYINNDEEKIYDVAELFLKLIKTGEGTISYKIEKCLKLLEINPNGENCEKFQYFLLQKLTKNENQELYRAIDLINQNSIKLSQYELSLTLSKLSYHIDNDSKQQDQNKFQNNKKKIYCDKWNQSMFLQHKDSGRSVRLCDAFVMPDYHTHWHQINHDKDDNLEGFIDKFINYQRRSTMLITGVPGIGKSSIVSWIANKYREDDRVIILRFRDWEREDLEEGILRAIRKTLECNKMDLEYKILILDGFDEIKALEEREELLHGFFTDILDWNFFKCIITSRPHYIQTEKFDNYIEIKLFDLEKIKKFYINIKGVELNGTISNENIGVYGIPVILYMSIMCDLDFTKSSSKPEIYNRIFSKDGGIFDRFSFEGTPFSEGAHILRDAKNIEKYLEFLRETAYKLFKSTDSKIILQKRDIPTLKFEQKDISILEFPLKPLFEKTERIEFVHYSIYEYFLSEYIFVNFKNVINKKKEKLAGIFGKNFKDKRISLEVLEFLQYKIRRSELNEKFEIVLDIFRMMLRDGMTYYVNEHCKPIVSCEKRIFENMLELLHIWEIDNMELDETVRDYLLIRHDFLGVNLAKVNLRDLNLSDVFLESANLCGANLRGANLRGANLRGGKLIIANLRRADLKRADLREANLRKADLRGADLRKANLREADLREADLREANLREADLREADLREADLREADLRGADLRTADIGMALFDERQIKYVKQNYNFKGLSVYVINTDEIISYEEYCKRRN